jgi:hypothetical protein
MSSHASCSYPSKIEDCVFEVWDIGGDAHFCSMAGVMIGVIIVWRGRKWWIACNVVGGVIKY